MLLLEDADATVQSVAQQVGCENAQYFTQIFKRIVGMTPGKWAQQMRE